MAADKRQLRKEQRLVQSESRWMQKALFALGKAETAREKLAETRKEKPATITVDGKSVSIDALKGAIADRVQALDEILQEQRQVMR